jgi:hypothetical protein
VITKKIKLTIHINVHEDGSRFYEWELRGVEREEAQRILDDLAKDMQEGQRVIIRSERGPREE